jgi:glycosyltransferase involved in cell wall biosynthesis
MENTIKVAWVCGFSNDVVRNNTTTKIDFFTKWMWKLIKNHPPQEQTDRGVWNTNAIKEFEKRNDIELHVITHCSYLTDKIQEFEHKGVHYHVFRDEAYEFFPSIYVKIAKPSFFHFHRNRRAISKLISEIRPDIVHLIGAENPNYSLSLLDVPLSIPTIVQLQTMMNDPEFKDNYPIDELSYRYRALVEKEVILRADYVGTKVDKFIQIVKDYVKPHAVFIGTSLALGETINQKEQIKKFDFVYFANNIIKAGDIALESFGMAFEIDNSITLNVVGEYGTEFKKQLDRIVKKYRIESAVSFEGKLKTHEDVINQISKAKIALLPLKIDIMSGTIREAMANGLPVITTDTGRDGTQLLNKESQTVLLSPLNNCMSLAHNMILLKNNAELAVRLKNNAFKYMMNNYNNSTVVSECVDAYRYCIRNKNKRQ